MSNNQELATTEQQTTAPAHKPSKERRIPRKIVQAIELILTGECTTQKAAAERVGITATWFSRVLQRDYVRVFCERRARQTIGAGLMRASHRLVELVDAGSEHVSLDATKHMLAIHGIKPLQDANVNVNIELKAGYVIDLSGRRASHTLPNVAELDGVASEINGLDANTTCLQNRKCDGELEP